jgi:hypothetical protein
MGARSQQRSYEGGCHCGAIEFTYESRLTPRRWAVRACQCTFCRGHGALTTSDPNGTVRFRYLSPDRLRRYRFALRTSDFLICRECGIYVGAVMLTGAGAVAVVNLNALRERPRGLAEAKPMNYRSESLELRRKRRREHWTPVFGPV